MQNPDENAPVKITTQKIAALRDHINNAFNAFDDQGELDLDKCQRNVAYSIGNTYTNYNGLLLQEKIKLAEINDKLKELRAIAYDKVKRFTDYPVDASNIKTLVDGSADVRKKQLEYDKQLSYVEFIEFTLKQLGYYSNGVKTLLQAEEIRNKYGF